MQIIFAAPFVLAAALVFTILSLIPRARRWAIPIPAGIIAAGPSLLVVFIVEALTIHFFDHTAWPGRWASILYVSSGILGGIVGGVGVAVLASFVANVLPRPLLRLAVVLTGWCSYFVMLLTLAFVMDQQFSLYSGPFRGWSEALALGLELLLSLTGAILVAQNAEQFRTRRMRLPYGAPFRRRGQMPPVPAADAR